MTREDLPHIQFYIGDWRRDVGVQSLSYHYRGIWLELLMLMHCSEQRGRLVLTGKPMSDASIARLLGLSPQEGANAIQVLLESGVASRDSGGALICRRMVRDEEERLRNVERVHRYRERKRQCNAGVISTSDNDIDSGSDSGKEESEEDWIRSLGGDPAYSHIRVREEFGKMRRWCEVNRRSPTRRRFINWLNRIEKPISTSAPKAKAVKPQPEGWVEWLQAHYPTARERDYWRVSDDVKREFNGR